MLYNDKDLVRFHSKYLIDSATGCWIWQGAPLRGYGVFYAQGKRWKAHRFSYLIHYNIIPDELHHKCETKLCINPECLQNGTHADNMMHERTTHCIRGHLRTKENTYEYRGERRCRDCYREWSRERFH